MSQHHMPAHAAPDPQPVRTSAGGAACGSLPPWFCECHAHVAMDAIDFKRAMARHANGPDERHVRACLEAFRSAGISFVRDGGDAHKATLLAAAIAHEYGIDYRTPAFAIHKKGHYGSIVGRSFETMGEYAQLVDEAYGLGADFIKIMTTGIMDFERFGRITHADLPVSEVREMVRIAHDHGLAVMAHTNGAQAVLQAVEAGVDSIEHGNYIDDECIDALAESRTCLVPTAAVARNLRGTGRFDEDTVARIYDASLSVIARAVERGCLIALGSDAGAIGVPHGQGALDEYACFTEAVPDKTKRDAALARGAAFVQSTFKRQDSH